MGVLREISSGKSSHLEPEHLVGRGYGCSLRVQLPTVSAEHARLRWAGAHWEVKDLGSLNGTFLNGQRIKAGEDVPIKQGAHVAFGRAESAWELSDDSEPQVMVVPLDGGEPVVVAGDLLVLPNDDDPKLTIYRSEGAWVLEHTNESTTPITNAQLFDLEGRAWRFCCLEGQWATAQATAPSSIEVRHVQLSFTVSRDEEFVEVRAACGGREVALGSRGFNYLLLTLARRRLDDAKEGHAEAECGWVYQEDYEHDPSMAAPQMNLDVFRIRRHFAAAGIGDAANIIERRPRTRQLRIGTGHLSIVQL